jgi:hypothetical protein
MHKVDGCLDGLAGCMAQSTETITGHPCGDPMPRQSNLLPASERDIIRRWIKQGAQP